MRHDAALSALRAHGAAPPGEALQGTDEGLAAAAPDAPYPFRCDDLAECHTRRSGRVPAADLQALRASRQGSPIDQGAPGDGRGAARGAWRLESASECSAVRRGSAALVGLPRRLAQKNRAPLSRVRGHELPGRASAAATV